MKATRIILLTVLTWIVSTVVILLTCGWLFTWVYAIPPMIWVTPETMQTTPYLVGSNVAHLVINFFFVLVFAILHKGIPGTGWKKGLMYGLLIWLVGALSMAIMPFYMTISTTVVIYWILQALVIYLINGLLVGALYKER